MRVITTNLLGCGCQRGYSLCSAAEILWRLASEAYMIAMIDPTSRNHWNQWLQARAAYDDHFEVVETNDASTPVENLSP